MTAYVANRLGPTVGGGASPLGRPAVYVWTEVVDFSGITHVADDTFKLLNLPPGSIVLAAGGTKLVADTAGNSGAINLGDNAAPTTFINGQVFGSTGEITHATTYFKGYAAADYLTAKVTVGAINGKVRFWALIANNDPSDTSQNLTFA